MSTTTTTGISSNSNSSCRLLDCLNTLPSHDQRVFRSLFVPIGLLRLSACCHSLRSSIRNDTVLWQQLYHRDFLSGAYYVKEMDFVLWCVRTGVNNPCTSNKRADLLENVDWYNTYRRRVSTENNWRFGRCKTTHIDMGQGGRIANYRTEFENNSIVIIQQSCSDRASGHSYSLEYLPHSNLRSSNNIVYNSTLCTLPNILSLGSGGNEVQYDYVTGDHYIAVRPDVLESDTDVNVKILTRKRDGIFTTFNIPVPYKVETIEGRWILLVHEPQGLFDDWRIFDIIVFDIDNSAMCPGSIDDAWNAVHFYQTTNNTAIVYTARLVVDDDDDDDDDDVDRIEWALYEFSNDNPVIQLRNGWFQLPEGITNMSVFACNSYNSHIMIELRGHPDYYPCILHNIASNGQSHTPRNSYTVSRQHIPIPLLRAGCDYLALNPKPAKVWTDLSYNDDQVLRIPDTVSFRNIIGDLYLFIVRNYKLGYSRQLVDINTKKIIRELEVPTKMWRFPNYTMVGMLCCSNDGHVEIMQEYGEL